MSTPPPAGWYNDPAGSDGKRWWDGERWTDKVDTPTPEAAPSPPPTARELLTGQKGGGVLIVFSALAAIAASVIVAVYLGELADATRYSQPSGDGLPVAAILFGVSSVLLLWGIYRAVEQIDEIYLHTPHRFERKGPTIAEAMAEHAKSEQDGPGA